MTKLTRILAAGALSLAVMLFLPGIQTADAAAFMKLGDIKGEATDAEHKDWIIIESVSAPATPATSGQATGKRQHKPFVITKAVDRASPMLQEASTSGKHFPTVVIEIAASDEGRATYLRYKLENVVISSYSTGGSAGGGVPMEEIAFNYEKIKISSTSANNKPKRKERDR